MVALEPGRFGAAKSNARDERAMVRSGMDSVVRCDRASSRKGRLLTANRAALRAAFKEDRSAKKRHGSNTRKQYASRNQSSCGRPSRILRRTCKSPRTKF